MTLMKNSFFRFIFFSVFFSAITTLHAQSGFTWSQILSNAERDYQDGRLTKIPDRLAGGFDLKYSEGGYSKEERIRAHKLTTLVYIFTDDEPKAEESLIKLLKADKEHKLNPSVDPSEFYFLYEKFRSKPIFRISVKSGVNKSFPNVIQSFSPANLGVVKKVYNGSGTAPGSATINGTPGIGFWVEALAERHLFYGIEVGSGFMLRNSRYDVDNYVGENPGFGDPALLTYVANKQSMLRIPVFARYNFRYFKDRGPIPYLTLGLTYDYLLNAEYIEANRSGGTSFSLGAQSNLKNLNLVNNNNMSAYAALGVKLRAKTHFLTFEARYDKGLFNYINPTNRWNGNQYLTYDLAFVEDDLALDMISFSIGYTYSVYSPKKLKQYR